MATEVTKATEQMPYLFYTEYCVLGCPKIQPGPECTNPKSASHDLDRYHYDPGRHSIKLESPYYREDGKKGRKRPPPNCGSVEAFHKDSELLQAKLNELPRLHLKGAYLLFKCGAKRPVTRITVVGFWKQARNTRISSHSESTLPCGPQGPEATPEEIRNAAAREAHKLIMEAQKKQEFRRFLDTFEVVLSLTSRNGGEPVHITVQKTAEEKSEGKEAGRNGEDTAEETDGECKDGDGPVEIDDDGEPK